MTFTRKTLFSLSTGACAAAALRFPAGAAEFSYKLAIDNPLAHPTTAHAVIACDNIRRTSDGRLDIRVYPNSQLGGQASMVDQTRLGAIEFLLIGDNVLATSAPVAAISGVPFAFSGYQQAWSVMDGALGTFVRQTIAAANLNLHSFGTAWDAGFRQMLTSVRPINEPDDLKGLKMRIPQAPMPSAMFKAFGASPVSTSAAEMYTALQTHLADGLDDPLVGVEAFKLYEVQKYVSITNHLWTGYGLHANVEAWRRLPSALQDLAERAFAAQGVAERTEVARSDAELETTLKGQGMIFNRADAPAFKKQLQSAGLYKQWRDGFGTGVWSILEKAVGTLA